MSQIRKYNNNYNQNWIPSFFNDFFHNDWVVRSHTTAPAINVTEDDQVINMEKKTENNEEDQNNKKYLRREFSYTKFEQSFVLPDNVDKEKIAANVNDGVLTITLPKETPEQKAKVNRSIEIQ